ncbi:MAG TPA: hypothetical protein VGE11_18350 [Pseudonocardia sp.]
MGSTPTPPRGLRDGSAWSSTLFHDGHPLAFLVGIYRVPARHPGVSRFGRSGELGAVDSIVGARA